MTVNDSLTLWLLWWVLLDFVFCEVYTVG